MLSWIKVALFHTCLYESPGFNQSQLYTQIYNSRANHRISAIVYTNKNINDEELSECPVIVQYSNAIYCSGEEID